MSETAGARTAAPRLTAAHFSLAAIGLMWTLPFLQPFHDAPLTAFYGDWLTLVLGLLALVALTRRAYWNDAVLPAATVPIMAFIAVIGLQHALGRIPYGGQALATGLFLGWALLLMALAAQLRRALGLAGAATVLAWFVAVGGFLGAVFALLQHYQVSDIPVTLVAPKHSAAVYGNLAQYNHFANYSALALASIAFLYASGQLHWAATAVGAGALVTVIGLSGSRSSLLFLAVVFVLAILYARRGGAGSRRLWVSIALFVAGFAAAQWLATAPGLVAAGGTETVSQRLVGGEGTSSAINIAHRLQLARESVEMFLSAPLLGAGWGQFPWHDFSYRALHGPPLSTWPFNHAHNVVLHLLAATGLAGTLLVAAAAVIWAWGLRRASLDLPHWWLLALLGVIAIHSLLEHPLWFGNFLGIAAVAVGLTSGDNYFLRFERSGRLLAAALLIVGLSYAAHLLATYRDFVRLSDPGGARPAATEQAAILGRAHGDPLLRPYAELKIASGLELDGDRLSEKLALNGRVMRFAPIAGVAYRQAMLLALAGEPDPATLQFTRAARVYPGDLPTAMRIMNALDPARASRLVPLIKLAEAELANQRAARDNR